MKKKRKHKRELWLSSVGRSNAAAMRVKNAFSLKMDNNPTRDAQM